MEILMITPLGIIFIALKVVLSVGNVSQTITEKSMLWWINLSESEKVSDDPDKIQETINKDKSYE